ncbi:hypothetical protein Tco_1119927, partial [Tanacetum coccineum]
EAISSKYYLLATTVMTSRMLVEAQSQRALDVEEEAGNFMLMCIQQKKTDASVPSTELAKEVVDTVYSS